VADARILIVDDDHDIRDLLAIRLHAEGYETVFAADAMTAVSVARVKEPRLILLDIGLPGGTGLVVMERLKNFPALAHIPVIVISARDPEATKQAALEAGARDFVQKPIDQQKLLEAIRAALAD
jgi:two-component system KDP operon response regulator KdpE